MNQQEIRLDFKTLDRERIMADMISEKNGIIQQLATEVQQLRAENDAQKQKLAELGEPGNPKS
jgi:hypothetical protein